MLPDTPAAVFIPKIPHLGRKCPQPRHKPFVSAPIRCDFAGAPFGCQSHNQTSCRPELPASISPCRNRPPPASPCAARPPVCPSTVYGIVAPGATWHDARHRTQLRTAFRQSRRPPAPLRPALCLCLVSIMPGGLLDDRGIPTGYEQPQQRCQAPKVAVHCGARIGTLWRMGLCLANGALAAAFVI